MKQLKDIGPQSIFTADLGEMDDIDENGIEVALLGGRYRVVIRDASVNKSEYWIDLFRRVGKGWECVNGIALVVHDEEPKRIAANKKRRAK